MVTSGIWEDLGASSIRLLYMIICSNSVQATQAKLRANFRSEVVAKGARVSFVIAHQLRLKTQPLLPVANIDLSLGHKVDVAFPIVLHTTPR